MSDASQREALGADLRWVAERLLRNVFKQAGGEDEGKYSTLARVLKTIVGEAKWRTRPNLSMIEVIRDAIDRLPKELSGRRPGHVKGNSWWAGKPERLTAEFLYGYRDDEIEPRSVDGSEVPKTYDKDYRTAALKLVGPKVHPSSARLITRVIREDLADILLAMEQEAIKAREEAATTANDVADEPTHDDATPFIPRPRLAEKLETVWQIPTKEWRWTAKRRVCLVGDAGTGKSRFAREQTAAEAPVWIDTAADETMLPVMVELLNRYEYDTNGLDGSVIKRTFGKLLTRADGPALVIVDGIADPEALDQFIPRRTHTKLVITSRRRPAADWSPIIEVGDLNLDEAVVMVAALLPQANYKDCEALAIVLGERPLLIEHGCAFITRTGTDIVGFCTVVGQDISTVLGAITGKTDRTLTAIYRRYAERLAQEAPQSLRLLELLAFVAHQYVPPEYVMSYLLDAPYIKRERLTHAQLAYDAATKALEEYSLITVTPGFGISIPTLVQNILRGIFADRALALFNHLQKVAPVSRESLYEEGWHIITVVGRATCNRILLTHLRDALEDGGRLVKEGKVGGVQWPLLMAHLWLRQARIEYLQALAEGRVKVADNGSYDWEGFLEEFDDRPCAQRDEAVAVMVLGEMLIQKNGDSNDPPAAEEEPDAGKKLVDTLIPFVVSLMQRYVDSPVGELDFSIVSSSGSDPTEEELEQARQYLYRLFEVEDGKS